MLYLENPRSVPFPQWGGSANYARRLVTLLPPHDVYVEPFCGPAAVFFAKERARREVLSDLNPEVVFTLRYIQQLDNRKLAALRRYPWRVSWAMHRIAQQTVPRSDAQRVWRQIYCRTATWGAKPTCHGYASINDGETYDLDQLWRFKERLRGVRIVN